MQKAYPATGSVDLFRVHLSEGRYSSSGVAKMSSSQNISVLHKRLTPLLAVLISSECTRAKGGILAVGVCTYSVACICNVGYAGKEVALGSGERCTGRGVCACSGSL